MDSHSETAMSDAKPARIRRLKYIEAFSAVIATGSISGAARQLGVSQPAVSQLIRKLEDSVGAPLFVRRNGAIFPTLRAESLREDAADLLTQIDRIQMHLSRSQTEVLSTIRLSASMTITNEMLPSLINEMHKVHPTTTYYVNSLPLKNMVEAVSEGHVDFAFHTQSLKHPNIVNEVIIEAPQVCVMPTDHPLAQRKRIELADLSGQRLITSSRKDPAYEYYRDLFRQNRIHVESVLQSPFAGLSMQMIESLNALSFNSALIADIFCKRNPGITWRHVEGLQATTSFVLGYASWLEGSETLSLIKSSFQSAFRPNLDELD